METVTPQASGPVAPLLPAQSGLIALTNGGEHSEQTAARSALRERGREWLLRGLFEAALILFGLLAAFALVDSAQRSPQTARATSAPSAVTAAPDSKGAKP